MTAYYEQTNFGFQYELAQNWVLETNYVGTWGRKLVGIGNLNTYPGRTALGTSGPNALRPNPNVGNINLRTNGFNSNYNAAQVTLSKRFSKGLQFNTNYTYSKALDEISDTFTPRGQSLNPVDSMNVGLDYGPADFNVKHRFVFSYNYELPIFRTNRWLGGWTTSGIVSVQSGVPFSLYSSSSSNDANKNGTSNDRLAFIGSGSLLDTLTGGSPADGYFDTSASGIIWAINHDPTTVLPTDTLCPLASTMDCGARVMQGVRPCRDALTSPGFTNIDFSIAKKFKIAESMSVQFQANFFNLLNHANFAIPGGRIASGNFGSSIATIGNPRVTQLALRFDF